ncbi:Planctomycete cytochrome C [Phycisphaerae bacterium RAS1]|nr:Planctomycete cytochrome C [Phycisphaerae bacterium RAS1]
MLQELMDAVRDVQTRHAMIVHLPIALSALGVPLVLALIATGGRNRTLRWVAIATYAALLGSAFASVQSGEAAAGQIGRPPEEIIDRVQTHEWFAEQIWIGAALTLVVLLLLSLSVRKGGGRDAPEAGATGQPARAGNASKTRPALGARGASLLAIVGLASFGLAGWTGITAHHGGTLVYTHGVGFPRGGATSSAATSQPAGDDPRAAHFTSAVRPLLDERCFGCHGGGRRIGGELRLTTMADILKGGEHGPALVPGKPDESLIMTVVTEKHDSLKLPQMPLNNDPLTAAEVEALRQWIRDGAVWR